MEKLLLLCIIILKSLDVCSQEYQPRDFKYWKFKRINDELIAFKNPERFADITASKRYIYWEVIYHDKGDKRGRVIWSYGDSAKYASTILSYSSESGFYYDDLYSKYYYIIAINEENRAEFIYDEESLYRFVGNIDNIEEAIIVSIVKGYVIDISKKKFGSYKETRDSYLLSFQISIDCENVVAKVVLSKTGQFNIIYSESCLHGQYF